MSTEKKRVVEIRAGEGGADARIFVGQLAVAYLKLAQRIQCRVQSDRVLDQQLGHQLVRLTIIGKRADQFEFESGGHRLQRVPPTERSGRVHSSTVTVAVLDPNKKQTYSPALQREESDFEVTWFSGTGCGGQNRNIFALLNDTNCYFSDRYIKYKYLNEYSNSPMSNTFFLSVSAES